MPTIPLRRLVDDDQWEAEDLAGRLGFVAHAAFLRAGFVPYGEEPSSGHLLKQVDEIGPSAPRLSRRYTAAQLACLDGEGADAAELELRARGDGNVALQAYLLTRNGDRRCRCEAVLDEDTLAPLLAGSVTHVARLLETEEPAEASLWRSLVDWVCPGLLLDLCRRNDLPVTGFASLPDDIKAEILKRLTDGKDLAMLECTSSQLRCLVAERDDELWKAMYASLDVLPEIQSSESDSEYEGIDSWKQRYVKGRRRRPRRRLSSWFFDSFDEDGGWFTRQMEADLVSYDDDDDDDSDDDDDDDSDDDDDDNDSESWFANEHWFARRRHQREADLRSLLVYEFPSHRIHPFNVALASMESTAFDNFFLRNRFVPEDPLVLAPEPEVVARGKNGGKRPRKLQRNNYQKKRHGAGAIHSPSSRYKWKHR